MSTISDLLGAEGAPLTFEHGGKTYEVAAVTQQMKSKIERWLKALAFRDLYALRESMPSDQYQMAHRLLLADRQRYRYLGEVYWDTVGTEEGSAGLVALLFGCTEAEAAKLIAERPVEVQALVQERVLESMPREQADAVRAQLLADAEARGGDDRPDPIPPA